MPKNSDQKLKEELLGAVKRPRRLEPDEEFFIDFKTVATPLTQEGTVARACCIGCGYSLELYEDVASTLAELAGVQVPDSWTDLYFEVQKCPLCHSGHQGVQLKRISDLM